MLDFWRIMISCNNDTISLSMTGPSFANRCRSLFVLQFITIFHSIIWIRNHLFISFIAVAHPPSIARLMHIWSCLSGSDSHLIIIKRHPSPKPWFIANYGSTSQGNHGLFRTCQSGSWWNCRNNRRTFPSYPGHHRRRQVLSSFHASVWPPVCLSVSNDVTALTLYGLQVSP